VAMVALGFALLAGIGYLSRWSHQTPAEEAQAAAAERDEAAMEHHRREEEIARYLQKQREDLQEQREERKRILEGYHHECEAKGLRFVGTLGDQVQCAP